MSLVIIGVMLSALGLVGVAASSIDRRIRVSASLLGAVGIVLLVASRPSTAPFVKQSEAIREMCTSTARRLQSFEVERFAILPPWTQDRTAATWDGIRMTLSPVAYLCVRNAETCNNRLLTSPYRSRFTIELHDLIVAFRTGEPCSR